MRLPPVYYTKTVLDGFYEPEAQQAPITKFIGETLDFEIYLQVENTPVTIDNWALTALLKTSRYAETEPWVGVLNNGIYTSSPQGTFKIVIGAEATKHFLPGTYWLDIQAKEILGRSNNVKDSTIILCSLPFGFVYSNYSAPTNYIVQATPEQTEPHIVDIKTR